MPPSRDTKAIAQRIDIRYPGWPSWFRWVRRWVIVLSAAGALLWMGFVLSSPSRRAGTERLLNPGPLAMAHAEFQNNCAACHDANGRGGFFKTVSDAACLNCHDAASHHPQADLNPGKERAVHLTSRRDR